MQYGYFDDSAKEYVITDPKTPLPWINYLGTDGFFSLISNTSGGYSFYKDAKLLRLTRYRYNDCPLDSNGHYYYIKDGNTVWNPGWKPMRTELDSYSCRHGLGYTVFTSEKNGVTAKQEVFVPLADACEVTRITLKNNSSKAKTLHLYSLVEFCLWNAQDDMSNFQRNFSTGEVEVEAGGSIIYHKTEYRERRNHFAVFAVNRPVSGFDTSRDAFCGAYHGFGDPETVLSASSTNSIALGWAPIGSHHLTAALAPGESRSFIFLLGKFTIQSTDEKLNRMVNIWNQYQCMVTFNMSRSASYYESGLGRGMGFRDSCQDLLGFVHLIPERARERILDIASTQFEDGSAYHQYQPLTKKGNSDIGSGFNDDPLWLIACTAAYLRETGDTSILQERCAFDNDESKAAPLLDHLRCSFRYITEHKGPHGLPLIGRADWNDCLNLNCFSDTPGESFQTFGPSEGPVAESVFIAGMYVKYGREFADILAHIGQKDEAVRVLSETETMYQAVIDNGWDGAWFKRAYDADSKPVGSKECKEGQIYIEPQGMCVMAGIGVEEGLAAQALTSVSERLDSKYGITLLQPAYTSYQLNLGEISSYPPGYKENAGIFCHNNPWISIAETVLGHGNRAFEIYKKTCPVYLEEISEIHRTEPYVYCQMVAGKDAPTFGEGKNSWLTGTAAWTFTNVCQHILGIRPTLDGLCIDPCIPDTLDGFDCDRYYRGAVYHIHVDNSAHVQKGVVSMTIDGQPADGNIIPIRKDKTEYQIQVTLGA